MELINKDVNGSYLRKDGKLIKVLGGLVRVQVEGSINRKSYWTDASAKVAAEARRLVNAA